MRRLGERGFIKTFLLLVVLAAAAYVGIEFGKPYYRYNTLRSHTKDLLSTELSNVDMLKQKIMADAAELNVPLKEENLSVVMEGKIIKVKATWSETVDIFWGYYQKQLDFDMQTEY